MSAQLLSVFVHGIPKAQPRPRAFARKFGQKWSARVYDAGTAEAWKSAIAVALKPWLPQSPLTLPLRVDSVFLLPRPKTMYRRKDPDGTVPHTGKPDRDNLDKAVLDCLTQIGFVRDDGCVCAGMIEKYYHAKDGKPGMQLTVFVL